MPVILSLQGCMAVGKTTAVNYIKESDTTRSRNFFEYYLAHLLPLKKEWFSKKENVDILNVDNLNSEEVAIAVKKWIDERCTLNENKEGVKEW